MTKEEILKQAELEMRRDFFISKEVRIGILRIAREGERFELTITAEEVNRLGSNLYPEGRMRVEKIRENRYKAYFNK